MLDPIVLRWSIAVLVLSLVSMLMSGWRYHGPPTLPITIGVGMFAGIGAGAVQIAGPPVILYWLGRGNNATTLRANLMVFFMFCGVVLIAVYAAQGLFTARPDRAVAAARHSATSLGMAIGSRIFRSASDRLYRNVAYVDLPAGRACSACRCSIRSCAESRASSWRRTASDISKLA